MALRPTKVLNFLHPLIRTRTLAFAPLILPALIPVSLNSPRYFASTPSTMGVTDWSNPKGDGAFKRQVSAFRSRVESGGEFPPEKGTLMMARTSVTTS